MAERKLSSPPKWAMRFFRWFCRKDLVDAVEGDLLELYKRRVRQKSRAQANAMFIWNVFRFIQPFALKSKSEFHHRLTVIDMLLNYLKIAYRNLLRSKSFTVINVLGLAIGISAFILMTTFVLNELSYDRFHAKSDRIFRVNYSFQSSDELREIAKVPFPLKPILLSEYPEVEGLVRFYRNTLDATTLRFGDRTFSEDDILFSDPEIFDVFDFELEQGNPKTALSNTNSIVMTRRAAKKYFGERDPIGQIIKYKNRDELIVTGILANVPENSHLKFDMLVPMELQRQRWIGDAANNGYDFEKDWKWSGAITYVLLKDPSNLNSFNQKLSREGADFFGRNESFEFDFSAFPLERIHLHSEMSGEIEANGNMGQVVGFAVIAMLILIIACINFINLNTARSTQRAKEVGLRKVMGALKSQLVGQFISESVLVTFLATGIGIFLVELLLPYFGQFMGKSLNIPYFEDPLIIASIVLGAVLLGLFSGVYPAFYLSRFQPSKTLKGNAGASGRENSTIRRFLVGGQFVVSNLLIIGILVVEGQLNFIKEKDLGFEKDQIIILKHGSKIDDEFDLFRSKISSIPNVVGANLGYVAGQKGFNQTFKIYGESGEITKSMGMKFIGYDFAEMFNLEVVAGRNFSRTTQSDSAEAMMLNETAVESLGWTNEEALGRRFSYIGGSDNKTLYDCRIVGVFKDANFESLYQPIQPSVFQLSSWGAVSLKLNAQNIETLNSTIEDLNGAWDELAPDWPFEYDFLEDELGAQYAEEERLGQTIQYFTGLAIFIACLGLFGLASFTVQQKRKEIGVRKVLGASVRSILVLVSKGFFVLIVVAFLIATPLGYWLADTWLQDFEFRISLGFEVFLIAAIISLGIACLAIAGQSLKAALSNPVTTLRNE